MNNPGDRPETVAELAPGLTRVLAPNPSPMTWHGTNSYLVGRDSLAVIDPGPDDPAHLAAILDAVAGRNVSHIIVTHSHLDHSPLARRLGDRLAAPVLAFGDSDAGRSAVMRDLAARGFAGGGEGVDRAFAPDRTLADGEVITGADWSLEVLHTPGHMGNHIALATGDQVLTGDLVMGWATSLVSPPDGDLDDFLASCARLRQRGAAVFHAGHGAPVADPMARLDWLIAHRNARSDQLRATLRKGLATLPEITEEMYHDTPPALHAAAARNAFAHLVSLVAAGEVAASPQLAPDAQFTLI